jgi:hypothetical protein
MHRFALIAMLCMTVAAGCSSSPTSSRVYTTYLGEYLANGTCRIAVVAYVGTSLDSARSYVHANGQPTAACPYPRVIVMSETKSQLGLVTGDVWHGRTLIFYSFSGGPRRLPASSSAGSVQSV